jgi:hypothetical protein
LYFWFGLLLVDENAQRAAPDVEPPFVRWCLLLGGGIGFEGSGIGFRSGVGSFGGGLKIRLVRAG